MCQCALYYAENYCILTRLQAQIERLTAEWYKCIGIVLKSLYGLKFIDIFVWFLEYARLDCVRDDVR